MDIKHELIFEDEDSQSELMVNQTKLESSESMKMCGEIYLKEYESFVIICIHCNTFFSKYEDFIIHLKYDHGNFITKPETLTEDNVSEYSNVDKVDNTNFVDVPYNPIIKLEYDNSEETTFNARVQVQENYIDSFVIKENKDLHCEICNVKFKTKKLFNEHQKSLHSIETDENVTQNNLVSDMSRVGIVRKKRICKFPCEICKKNFRSKKSLNEHNEVMHHEVNVTNLIKNVVDLVENKTNFNLKMKKERIRKFPCEVCKITFKTRKALVEHEAKPHTLESTKNNEINNRFECSICKKPYAKKEFLKRHENSHKSYDESPFKCETCKKSFSSKIVLDGHIRWHNNDILPCRVCGKAFYRNDIRRSHERIHGEKTLLCTICGKKFFKNRELEDHVMRHKGIKPHKCEFCDMSFTSRNELVEHRRKHTKEKPYECDICKARFTINKSLKTHKKLHSDTADYKCNICGKSFKQFAGLYVHKKNH